MTLQISRTYTFDAAHHLPNTPDDHKCHQMHGHTWEVTIWVSGELGPATGWIMDYAVLDDLWRESVHDVLDHRCLNDVIPNPTTEYLAQWIHLKVSNVLPEGCDVSEISIREGASGRCRLVVPSARA